MAHQDDSHNQLRDRNPGADDDRAPQARRPWSAPTVEVIEMQLITRGRRSFGARFGTEYYYYRPSGS